jgi:hypothetical protein
MPKKLKQRMTASSVTADEANSAINNTTPNIIAQVSPSFNSCMFIITPGIKSCIGKARKPRQ